MAAESTQIKVATDGALVLADGTGTPVTLALSYYDGDFQMDAVGQYLNEEVIISTNGRFKTLARGDRRPIGFSFTVFVGSVVGGTSSAPGTPLEFITGKGAYSANVSTLGANRNMTVDVRLSIEGTAFGDSADQTLTLEDCVCKGALSSSKDGFKLSISGTCLGSLVIVNNTNTVTISEIS